MTQLTSISRREALFGSLALTLLSACQTMPARSAATGRSLDKIGIQTYTLREALGEDFVGTFEMIKEVGYDYVELNGRNFEGRSVSELKAILDGAGLPAPASHLSYEEFSDTPEQSADMLAELDCKYAILPYLSDDQRGLDDYKRHAEMLNTAADIMRGSGVGVAYHNHQFEFDDLGGGVTGMDILLSETDPTLVDFEIDLFWAILGRADLPALFSANPGRFKLSHVKDMNSSVEAYRDSLDYSKITSELMVNVGEGVIDFGEIFALNDVSGMRYFIAEHDNPKQPYRQSIATSYETLKGLRF